VVPLKLQKVGPADISLKAEVIRLCSWRNAC